jgi:WD domain, G-beta repeat
VFVAAARGRARAEQVLAAMREAAAPEAAAPAPYLGLVPFQERDARLFYGRDELADRLAERLAERLHGTGILLVTGESAFLGAAHHAARRAARRRQGVIAGLLALAVIAVSAAGLAVRDAADASRQAASSARQHAIALSRQLATESLAADGADPLTARRLAVAAWRVFPTDQAGSLLATLLMEQQQGGILPGNPAHYSAIGVAFSPDGKLAAVGADGTVQLLDPVAHRAVGAALIASTSPEGPAHNLAFSPDGTLLAAAYSDGHVRLWDLATRQAAGAPLPAYASQVRGATGVAFSPDGKLLASGDGDGTVRTWQMPLFADPYAALCADVGPQTKAEWTQYAPGEPQPNVCR